MLEKLRGLNLVRVLVAIYCIFFFFQVIFVPVDYFTGLKFNFLQYRWWFFWLDEFPTLFQSVCMVGISASIALALNFKYRLACLVIWICLVIILSRNFWLFEVHLSYLGWTLWLFMFLPSLNPDHETARQYHQAVLFAFGAGYTLAGATKLIAINNTGGQLLESFFNIGFGFSYSTAFFGALSSNLVYFIWISVTIVELLALPLIYPKATRQYMWWALTLGQLALLLLSRLNHISAFMLIYHLLALDSFWHKSRASS